MFRLRPDPIDALLRAHGDHAGSIPSSDEQSVPANPSQLSADASADAGGTEQERTTEPTVAADPRTSWPANSQKDRGVDPVVIGTPSTFGAAAWWRSGWWPLTATGDARDVLSDVGTIGDLAVAAVTSRGHKHRLDGTPCQDAFHLRSADSPSGSFAVVAVCDGVGSAPQSHLGSQRLSRTITLQLAERLERGDDDPDRLLADALASSVAQIADWAASRGVRMRDLETTLTVALVPAATNATSEAIIAWIGDSPAFLGRATKWLPLTRTGATEAVASSATRGTLTADPEVLEVRRVPLQPGERLLLCSDGIGAFIGDEAANLALGEHLGRTLASPCDLTELVRQTTFDLRSADDDRTLAVIWKAPADTAAPVR